MDSRNSNCYKKAAKTYVGAVAAESGAFELDLVEEDLVEEVKKDDLSNKA